MTESSSPIPEYYAALRRLQEGRPLRVARGSKITNDAVSIEAGRNKGSIKKSRAIFADLIRDIEAAALAEKDPTRDQKAKLTRTKDLATYYRAAYEAALVRELSLLKELYEVKKKLESLTNEKVIPLRKSRPEKEG
jgi:hypothetical protein